jgi:hypothetical protein
VAHASESDVSDLSCTLNKSKFRNRATREQQVDAIVFCLHRCMGCQGGASAVGLGGIVGEVEAGRLADCVLYDLTAFSLLPRADPIASLVLSSARPQSDKPQVAQVWVEGKLTVAAGKPSEVDLDELSATIEKLAPSYYDAMDVERGGQYDNEYRAALGLPFDDAAKL